MPRVFLVKRHKSFSAVSYRPTDGPAADVGGLVVDCHRYPGTVRATCHSPDSGYGGSPVKPAVEEQDVDAGADFGALSPSPASVQPPTGTPPPPTQTDWRRGFESDRGDAAPVIEGRLWASGLKTPTTPPPSPGRSSPARSSKSRKRPFSSPDSPGPTTPTRSKPRSPSARKPKVARRINFDQDAASPVLGTFIVGGGGGGDEGKEEKTGQQRGAFVCQLCREGYRDAPALASHKCSRIAHVQYRCPECGKVFNCHANLASHRRWHKLRPASASSPRSDAADSPPPRTPPSSLPCISPGGASASPPAEVYPPVDGEEAGDEDGSLLGSEGEDSRRTTPSPVQVSPALPATAINGTAVNSNTTGSPYVCDQCGKAYRRPANLRRHLRSHGEAHTHPCYNCGQTFSSLTGRAKHVLSNVCWHVGQSGD